MTRREMFALIPAMFVVKPALQAAPVPVMVPPSTNVVIELDGRKLAEMVVPHLPDVVRKYGL